MGLAHAHHLAVSNADWILRADEQREHIPNWCVEQELCGTYCFALLRRSEVGDNVAPTHSDFDLAVYERIGLSEVHLTRTSLEAASDKQTSCKIKWAH